MANASELRIGNYVIKKSFGTTPNHIDKVDGAYIKWVEEDGAECYGIPLTPEILEQCGFKKNDYLNGWTIDKFIFYIDEEMNLCLYDDNPSEERIVRSNIQLHTLQNLFFALTGQELNIELNAPVSDTTTA